MIQQHCNCSLIWRGDALNVAHLVPLSRWLSRSGLVDALMAHYGSPGRLADYRRQFERTTKTVGEDPAIFATELETLAVKAFGDMGQTARLCLIKDWFISGHSSCELRRHLDSVPPETPIRDVAAFGRATPTRQFAGLVSLVRIRSIQPMLSEMSTGPVAAVTGQRLGTNQLEDLLRRLIQPWNLRPRRRRCRQWKSCYSEWWRKHRVVHLWL